MNQNRPQHISFLDIIWRFKYQLALYIVLISFLTFTGLYLIGGVPTELQVVDSESQSKSLTPAELNADRVQPISRVNPSVEAVGEKGELPTRVIIKKIGVNTTVHNPTVSDDTTLNNLLLKGAVRYPGSGTLGHGNMFLFGHSSHLKVINNQAYKAFNDIEDLVVGDEIRIQSDTKEYIYAVSSVALVDSNKALVELNSKRNIVTLSTCNVFGEKQERYVVEATFVKEVNL